MAKYITAGLLAVAATLFIANIVVDVIKYYKRKKHSRSL